jgi:hypothetical protein
MVFWFPTEFMGFREHFKYIAGMGFHFNLPIAVVVHLNAKYLAGGGISPPPAP